MMENETELVTKLRELSDGFACPPPHAAPRSGHARLVAELIQAVRARDTFIAIAAHELRNPMTPILGHIEYMLAIGRRADNGYPEAVIIELERLDCLIGEYIRRATTLLDISRITTGQFRAELSVVDLSRIMRQAVHRHRTGAERIGCRLEPSIEDNVSGLLDELAVEQIVDNLLSNAVKYGAGEPIEVSLFRNGTAARLTVRDHGIGTGQSARCRFSQETLRGDAGQRARRADTGRSRAHFLAFHCSCLSNGRQSLRDPAGAPVPICQQGEVLDLRSLRACRAILGESL